MNPVDDFIKTAWFMNDFKKGLSQALPSAAAAVMMTAGAHSVAKGYDAIKDRLTKTRDFKAVLKNNPQLKQYDAGHVQMAFNSLRMQAPTLSKDPLVAGSFIHKTLEYSPDDGPFVDPQTLKSLTDTQRNISNIRGERNALVDAFRPTQMAPVDHDPFPKKRGRP